jgi:hypothetical protein
MNTRIILIAAALLIVIIGAVLVLNNGGQKKQTGTLSGKKTPEQFIVLLDLSDRITQPGQIDADKKIILNTFEEFEKKVHAHLVINSKDRFQVCIAPQKNLPFDKDIVSERLTLDLSAIKPAERVPKIKEFKNTLSQKLDSLYERAYHGEDTRKYQGSNIWQFFNEELPILSSDNVVTKVVVLTDGYFDFEEGNANLSDGKLSTSTEFLSKLRGQKEWKAEIDKNGFGILPIRKGFHNTIVCVSEIRSKFASNLNETEMLQYVWTKWLDKNGIPKSKCPTLIHGNISTTTNQLSLFFCQTI